MLVQFSMKNVLSFKEEAVLDMTAVSAYKEHVENLVDISDKNNDRLVRAAAIYGANASGKSNIFLGMAAFQRIVVESMNNIQDDKTAIEKYYIPYLFDDVKLNSEFQVIKIIGDYEYRYGFEYNDKCVAEEWLYRKNLNTNRTIPIFERDGDNVEFGASVKKYCEAYGNQIQPETLVLSFMNKLKLRTDVFVDVYLSITNDVVASQGFSEDRKLLQVILPSIIDHGKSELLDFLSAIDVGIKDIKYDNNENHIRFITYHEGKNGNKYQLGLDGESSGTIKSIILFIHAKMAINGERLLFIDELNDMLHPLLQKKFVDLFYSSNTKAQLVYTTHDTTLLDKHFFRRDQIWFADKDEYGCSQLYALSDFKVRSDASFEKDYLAGVYGAIPVLKDFDFKKDE